jgi:hypothetical protein
MADNTQLSAAVGSGDTIATDDVAGVKFPRSKITLGADGANDGDLSATNPMPVKGTGTAGTPNAGVVTVQGITSMTALKVDGSAVTQPVSIASVPSHAVTNAGTFAVQENGAALSSLQLIDNIVLLEDAASANGDPGVQILTVRKDTAAATSGTDGDYQPLITDASGRVYVNVGNTVTVGSHDVTNAGTFAVQAAQSGTWNIGTVTTVTTVTTLTGITNVVHIDDNSGSITVDGSVSVSGVVAGTSATSLGKAEDAVAADGDTGVMALAVRKDTAATTVGADGDYHPLEVNANGRLWCSALIDAALPAGSNVIGGVTQSGTWNVGTVTSLTQFNGNAIDTNSGSKSAGTLRVVLATDQPQLTNKLLVTPDANSAVNISQMNGVTVTMGNGVSGTGVQRVTLASDSTGQVAIAAGSASIGTVQPGNTQNTTAWLVTDIPATSGGLTISKTISAATTNATSVKGSAGQLFHMSGFNNSATIAYLKLYNKATAPTVGSDTPVAVYLIPGNTSGAGFVINIDKGIAFATGIAFAITGGIGDSDTTAVSANVIVVNLGYK